MHACNTAFINFLYLFVTIILGAESHLPMLDAARRSKASEGERAGPRAAHCLVEYCFFPHSHSCRRTISMETGFQNIQLCSTILNVTFPPDVIGPLFFFPLLYMIFQLSEGFLFIIIFRCYEKIKPPKGEYWIISLKYATTLDLSYQQEAAPKCSNSTSRTVSSHVSLVLEIKPRTLGMLRKHSTRATSPEPCLLNKNSTFKQFLTQFPLLHICKTKAEILFWPQELWIAQDRYKTLVTSITLY